MTRIDGGTLREWRRSRGWDVPEMAQRLRRAAREAGVPVAALRGLVRMIYAWERGDHAISERYQLLYAKALDLAPERLPGVPADPPDVPDLAGSPVSPLILGISDASAEASYPEPSGGQDGNDVRRRELLGVLSGAVVGAGFAELERLRRSVDSSLSAPPTGRDADEWERTTSSYAHEVGVLPSRDLLPRLLADFSEAGARLTDASGHTRHRLARVVAELGALTAITFVSLGDPHTADRWWRTAARAADEAGDHRSASLIRGRHAIFSLYSIQPARTVLSLADEAIAAGRYTPCAGVTSGYAARAQALAQLGSNHDAQRALSALAGVFERLPAEVSDDRWSAWGWSEVRLRHVESYVHTYVGDISAAGRAQDAALELYPQTNYQGRAQVELHRAECLIRMGDIDSGAQHAAQVLGALPPERRTDGLVTSMAQAALSAVPVQHISRPAVRTARGLLALPSGRQ